ncbi:LLM class flavin-dependent oxidoreductase [Saccharomonospora glauca]|uniref:Flavin-dependent oxidoreductase, F420-dependent methylene-tetrahydromethanopterin reductase n=1 Tax=Saccharomonospora glauca K62 TaxID=928724 RepID=I1D5L3_9PSEU|nr:LLM class flavin-dependent oxidoreductase [Saccharomonospora glauca]EIF00238.1 flavin-dependent oxidoreductase, F420-dependent methylene-tetrahydromethanopterin reductase [Saccharomonospora glauca K62]
MRDYGHNLRFGTFLTPASGDPERVVRLAQLSEREGLDLVTFQDHPYQPAFLDTWTLLSFVAARTERILLAPNVANLPLRPPAVLAQAAASLDLLSGGRLELGLGAGGFWDAIEAMGAKRLTPGESVVALEEAVTVIRQLWDTSQRGGVRHHGEHYRIVGAKRGPAPAHRVPIVLGAYKPRMLKLVGRVADGWLPSLFRLSNPEDLSGMNDLVDEAAIEAGRKPSDIRRWLNIGPDDRDPRALAELALEYGVSTFILSTDDADVITEFGRTIAPEVRDLVGSGNGTATTVPPEPSRPTESRADTLDDGTRYGEKMPWDESTRPTAPRPSDDTPPSPRGRAVSQHLVDVHNELRTELRQLRDLVDQVERGTMEVGTARSQLNQMALRQNNWTMGAYCESYCRVVTQHHTIEDEGIFPHLRSVDDGLAPVLDRLEAEHRVIHDVLDGVDKALVRLVSNPDDGHAELRRAVDLLTDTLLSHFAYEERELLEPIARHGMYPGQL